MRTTRSHLNRRKFLQLTSGVGTLSIAGCLGRATSDTDEQGDSPTPEHEHDAQLEEPVAHADVAMKSDDSGHHFDPHLVWIERGGTVTWTNESGAHTTTAYHPEIDKPLRMPEDASPWDSGMFSEPGKTFEYTFEVEGVYDYFCIPHEYRAMVGRVIVGEPDLARQPALTPPQEDLPEEAQALLSKLNTRTEEVLEHTSE